MGREARAGMRLVDRLVLLVAWVVTCGLVYLLGVYVGRGSQERRLGLEDRLVRLPVTSAPPPEGRRPKSDSEFVFYDKLMGEHPGAGGAGGAGGAAHEPPRPVAVESPHATPPPASGLPSKRPSATPSGTAVSSANATVRPVAGPARTSRPDTPAAAAEAPATAPVAGRAPSASSTPPSTGGSWTVLANPTRSRDEADGMARGLRARGYEASLVRVVRDGDTWYRVQVGRFATAAQATEVMRRLREHEGVSHVFVASE